MTDLSRQVALVEASGLFDREWYASEYRDVRRSGIDPIEHYLRWGARMHRNPSREFDTGFYLKQYPDVAKSGINPLVHYIRHGKREGRRPVPSEMPAEDYLFDVDVVVPVYNALDDVQSCLQSVVCHRDGLAVRLIVVNDGSNDETTSWLRGFAAEHRGVDLIENPTNLGYTRAVNVGLRASTAAHVVTLNSDTIVTSGWLRGLLRCMRSKRRIGIVGPLSNAASWQSVPKLYDEHRQFAINDTAGLTVDEMASVVSMASSRRYPEMPFVNGFCFMVSREVISAIGFMDEANFPVGFGEENDYCIRAADAGFKLAIADDVYVFHAKSKSFGHDRRKELSKAGSEQLRRKHTDEKFNRLVQLARTAQQLDLVRRDVRLALEARGGRNGRIGMTSLRILYLLPVQGGGGGAHSVVQEAAEMMRMGVSVKVAVPKGKSADFVRQYPEIPRADRLFIEVSSTLVDRAGEFDVVIGTIYRSMGMVREVVNRHPHVMPAYYVQDYEPLFFSPGSEKWREARDSYGLVPKCLMFAKTAWIIGKVKQEHGLDVVRVQPSIDHDVYFPGAGSVGEATRVCAMVRPQTPRRGADRTMRIFKRLSERFDGKVAFDIFGCDPASEAFQQLERNFDFVNHGRLTRAGVAGVLRSNDVFVDLSDYQAFGRTGLEAMACGCVSAVTCHGGADEYAIDGVNAIVVDSLDEDACFERIADVIRNRDGYQGMRAKAIETAAAYSVHRAAVSVLSALVEEYSRQGRTVPARERLKRAAPPARPAGGGRAVQGSRAQATEEPDVLNARFEELARLTRVLMERERRNEEMEKRINTLEKENRLLARRIADHAASRANVDGSSKRTFDSDRGRTATPAVDGSKMERDAAILRGSALFDAAWYLAQYQDAADSGLPAEVDYLVRGAKMGRDPGPDFSTSQYLKCNPDVARAGVNPLVHYLRHGIRERRQIWTATSGASNG